jgi:hypothetical protein
MHFLTTCPATSSDVKCLYSILSHAHAKNMVPIAFAFQCFHNHVAQLNHWKQVPSTLYDISGQSGNRVSVVLNQKHSVGRHGLLRLGENMALDFN